MSTAYCILFIYSQRLSWCFAQYFRARALRVSQRWPGYVTRRGSESDALKENDIMYCNTGDHQRAGHLPRYLSLQLQQQQRRAVSGQNNDKLAALEQDDDVMTRDHLRPSVRSATTQRRVHRHYTRWPKNTTSFSINRIDTTVRDKMKRF